jgi:hypothetical protein
MVTAESLAQSFGGNRKVEKWKEGKSKSWEVEVNGGMTESFRYGFWWRTSECDMLYRLATCVVSNR